MKKIEKSESATSAAPMANQGMNIFGGIIVVLLLIVAFQLSMINTSIKGLESVEVGTGNAAPTPTQQPTQQAAPTVDVSIDDDYILGDEDAPITIIEFSDFECPFCSRFHQQTLPQLMQEYINTGKARLVYRDFPLSFHPDAKPAAIAANCAGEQGKYYEMHDKLFENNGALSAANYNKWAEELGLDMTDFAACLTDPKQAQEIDKDFADGQKAGVSGTPTFFINGQKLVGAQPFVAFQQIIDAELN